MSISQNHTHCHCPLCPLSPNGFQQTVEVYVHSNETPKYQMSRTDDPDPSGQSDKAQLAAEAPGARQYNWHGTHNVNRMV